ncbi:MAG: ubiquitin-conjugating enzyme family protein [Candidatus Heimdallarchaeaceae archaeon]
MSLDEEEFFARLAIEANELKRELPTFKPIDGDMTHLRGFIFGTGLYEGGVFVLDIIIPREYPFKPPKVECLTKIFHPNFFNRRICVGVLGVDWTPANNLVDVIESIRFLLGEPNPDDPLNSTAANLMKRDPKAFEQKAREYVEKYASFSQIQEYGL